MDNLNKVNKMKKTKQIIIALSLFSIVGCVTTATNDKYKDQSCFINFSKSGSILTGEKFETHSFVPVNKKLAINKLKNYLALDGWLLSYSDEQQGIIQAVKSIALGNASPLTITATDAGEITNLLGHLSLQFKFSTEIGEYTPPSTMKIEFCKMIEHIEKS